MWWDRTVDLTGLVVLVEEDGHWVVKFEIPAFPPMRFVVQARDRMEAITCAAEIIEDTLTHFDRLAALN